MDILQSLSELLTNLNNDECFLDKESKESYAKEQLTAFLQANTLAESDASLSINNKGNLSYTCILEELMNEKITNNIKIIPSKADAIRPSKENTNIDQRKTLESIIKNLCYCLNIDSVECFFSSRNSTYYRPAGSPNFQSASNTILSLSFELAKLKIKTNIDK